METLSPVPIRHFVIVCFRLSGSDMPAEDWLWGIEKHGPHRSVIRKVKRFLSTSDHPSSPRRRTYGRQASDSSVFFPSVDLSPTRDLLDVPPRSPYRATAFRKQSRAREGSPKMHSSLGELSMIRETSRTSTLQSLTPQSSMRASPTKMPQVPEVLITTAEAVEDHQQDSTSSTQSLVFTGVQPSGPGQQQDLMELSPLPSEETPQNLASQNVVAGQPERNPLSFDALDENDMFPKRWSLPGFLESSQTSLAGLDPDPVSSEPTLLLDTETSSEISGTNVVSDSPIFHNVLYLVEDLDTKETDIIESSHEQTEESLKGQPGGSKDLVLA